MLVCRGAMRARWHSNSAWVTRFSRAAYPQFFAAIRGVPGIDLNPGAPSVFRFGAQNRDELAPASVTDTPIEPGLRPGSVRQKLPGFSGSGTGLAHAACWRSIRSSTTRRSYSGHECAGLFVVKVLALIRDLAMPRRNRLPAGGHDSSKARLRRASRCCAAATDPAAVRTQRGLSHRCPSLRGRVAHDPDVDTGLPASRRQRIRRDVIAGEHQHPAPPFAFDLDRLHPALHRRCRSPSPGRCLADTPALLGQPAGAIAVFGPLDTVEPGRP